MEWLWYPNIPYRKLTLLQGDPGEGKSTFIINIAVLLTQGKDMPDGYPVPVPQTVIYQCSEDNASDTVKPRLLIFDPLQSFIPQDSDMHSAGKMRLLLGKLAKTAERHKCAVVLVGHMNKSKSGKSLYGGLGSIDITAIARSVLMIARDGDNPQIRYMYPIKSSLAAEGDVIGFRFGRSSGFQWLGVCDYENVDFHEEYENKEETAGRVLLELLAEDMESRQIFTYMKSLGISNRTVYRVKKELGIISYKKNKIWMWRLPDGIGPLEMEAEDGQ